MARPRMDTGNRNSCLILTARHTEASLPKMVRSPPPQSLTAVLEYFATSPFYDRQSNNQVLKMQSQFNMLGDLNQRLSSMRGIEFVVHSEHPPDLWIIRKQRRSSPEEGSPLVLRC
jgi:MED6 mediator sub complex component